jgi:hypothetical protein
MARITIKDFKTTLGITETYDIVNAIRNSESDKFQQYVPLANADNIAEVGAGLLASQTLQNDFITSLVDRISKVVIKNVTLKNQLAKFKKGNIPLGRTIEEIFTDITREKKYDPEASETTVFKREIPNVKTLFHERNRQVFYEQTISDDQLKAAFTSWGNFEGFLASIVNAIYNSSEVDEFKYMKLLIDNYASKGLFTVVSVNKPDTETATREFAKKLRATARKMSLPTGSRDYNALAVHTKSDMNDLHLIIDADLEAEMDVDVLAKAFNMDKTSFMGHVTVIDGFATAGLEAVLIDKEWFMVYDNNVKMETIRNPKGLYWNYFYHIWQTLSVSRFSNAVAFMSGAVPAVTQVIVDPAILALKQGGTFEYTAYVRATDGNDHDVVWSVEGGTGATTITQEGVLTLDANQTGQLTVKATVVGMGIDTDGAGTDTADVVGESIVTVIPATI